MSALCARRHDLPLLFDKVAICQIDCWRIQPNTELPETCNELISFPDSAPAPAPPPPPQHYTTVPYSTELCCCLYCLLHDMGPSYRDPRAFEFLGQSGLWQLIEKALPQDNRDKTGSNTDRGDDLLDSYDNDMYEYDRAYSAGYYWVATSDPVAMREPFDWVREER
ncbi:hypothetical protein V498_03920 [Pseudogymnoascus sp. VKM F-4517 (FW-2822)]|nr:hypothetical protein V498_03920 [Pseudogymnoascus sp. VKM F-4517 (FW-2822)]